MSSKLSHFLWVPEPPELLAACNRNRTGRRAHEDCSARTCLLDWRKGEPKVKSKTGPAFKGRTPKARSCRTLLHRQTAQRRPAPHSLALKIECVPRLMRVCSRLGMLRRLALDQLMVFRLSYRVGDSSGYAVGAWGKSVPGKVAFMGQSAAHGQITERKYSVARLGF
jgi:hypothetical protein